jgi:hypothetical protein
MYATGTKPHILRFTLPASTTLAKGTVVAEKTTVPGQIGAFANADATLNKARGILRYSVFSDAAGNVYRGTAGNIPLDGISSLGAQVYVGNAYFNLADLTGLDANALASNKNWEITHGVVGGAGVLHIA